MNSTDATFPCGDDDEGLERAVQRCIDGELAEADELQLFDRLDLVDGGWKQLALGFLEERLLRDVCGEVVNRLTVGSVLDGGRSQVRPSRPVGPMRTAARWLRPAVAGCLLLGAFLGGRWSVPADAVSVAESARDDSAGESSTDEELIPEQPLANLPDRLSGSNSLNRPGRSDSPQTWVNFQLPGSDKAITVPVYRSGAESAARQTVSPPVLSPEELEYLRQSGYVVDSEERLLEIDDGRGEPIVVPWETVHVRLARY